MRDVEMSQQQEPSAEEKEDSYNQYMRVPFLGMPTLPSLGRCVELGAMMGGLLYLVRCLRNIFARKAPYFDTMFGLKHLYGTNHYWFLNSYVFNNSRLYPPKYNESTLEPIPRKHFYIGHLGGMEGMRQKLWTIITICLIKLAAERSNLAIDIMCQGDNQVVMIRYKPNQILKKIEIRGRFLTNLSEILQSVNLSLKLEETWFSIRLCEFGKVRFFDG